jgi:hypothetical protein
MAIYIPVEAAASDGRVPGHWFGVREELPRTGETPPNLKLLAGFLAGRR